ncbi:MAG: flavodoxin-dependent (E)-4-hydroxy-3-methylbut-2-enyl-diphosphate synthase, partial [Flavobacteriales bacterium]
CNYSVDLDKWNLTDQATDFIFIGDNTLDFEVPGTLGVIQNYDAWQAEKPRHYPLITAKDHFMGGLRSDKLNLIECSISDITERFVSALGKHDVVVLKTTNANAVAERRRAIHFLLEGNATSPIILKQQYADDTEAFQLYAATDAGALLIDGLLDGTWLSADEVPNKLLNSTSFGILQASRARISKTEYISCPSCGRTLFDLQETTAKIRNRTDHLKGVKIGIMGCIVNGPGEMADADYGYVGTGKGKITLYKGQDVVERNIPSEEALEALENLIKENGDWVERAEAKA